MYTGVYNHNVLSWKWPCVRKYFDTIEIQHPSHYSIEKVIPRVIVYWLLNQYFTEKESLFLQNNDRGLLFCSKRLMTVLILCLGGFYTLTNNSVGHAVWSEKCKLDEEQNMCEMNVGWMQTVGMYELSVTFYNFLAFYILPCPVATVGNRYNTQELQWWYSNPRNNTCFDDRGQTSRIQVRV